MTVIALWLFLTVSLVSLRCVMMVFPDHTHSLFFVGKPNFSDTFKKIIKVKKWGYNSDAMQQSAWLVVRTITDCSYRVFFNCMTVRQASDSMTTALS